MLINVDGYSISVREVQSENARFPILTKEFDSFTSDNVVQNSNALVPIAVTPSGISIFVSKLQPLNAQFPILVTVSGIAISSMLDSANKFAGILVIPSPKVTVFIFGQFAKIPQYPTSVNDDGIYALSNALQFSNTLFPSVVKLSGSTTSFNPVFPNA